MSARVLDIRPNLRVSNIGLVNYFEAKADGVSAHGSDPGGTSGRTLNAAGEESPARFRSAILTPPNLPRSPRRW